MIREIDDVFLGNGKAITRNKSDFGRIADSDDRNPIRRVLGV